MKKILLFIVLIIISIGGAYYLYFYKKPIEEVSPNTAQILNIDELDVPETCDSKDTLSYYYYKDSDWSRNNKFGLYVYAENKDFFEIAQKLVNSKGGDWGYVLIPYNVKDYDSNKWGRVFDQLRNKHLIPVIQLWDVDTDDYEKQTEKAVAFLDSFAWPIKERYISVYNEPNSKAFWYGRIDPIEYAQILDFTIDSFNNQHDDFFLLNGAFNVSAATDGNNLDSFVFMSQMNEAVPGIFNKLDGWASHPYPQPNFSGSPYAYGRWSVRAYEDELSHLKNLGVEKDLPVFITETGWAHAEGKNYDYSFLPVDKVAKNFKIAFEEVWLPDDRVRAVMPFTIRYDPPFDHFSWINSDDVPYKHYDSVKSMKKVSGNPSVLEIEEVSICSNL